MFGDLDALDAAGVVCVVGRVDGVAHSVSPT
jgi:hypothetical protein